jgi:uncharacterized protein YhhL (DUF1145 family)
MTRNAAIILYVLVMIVLIVGLDVTLLRGHFTARLIVNIAIVLMFGAGWLLVFRRG